MRRFRPVSIALLACCVALLPSRAARASEKDPTPQEVRDTINRTRNWLIGKQQPNGSFAAKGGGHTVGVTCLAMLALLNSGSTTDDAHVKKGLKFLRALRSTPKQTYDISLMAMVLSATRTRKLKLAELVERLELGQAKSGRGQEGGWSYYCTKGFAVTRPDRSNSQFAVLALRDAVHAGVSVKKSTWQRVKKYWEQGQGGDWGWGYLSRGGRSLGSMTVAGIASLVIVDRMLQDKRDWDANGKPLCCAERKPYERLDRAIARLGTELRRQRTVVRNFSSGTNTFYYLYGLERAGRLSGLRLFGGYDWYREGVKFFRKRQQRAGFWVGNGFGEGDRMVATSMALLFLSKGLAPVLVNKLKYGKPKLRKPLDVEGDDWNRHRNDARNLTDYITTRDNWPKLLTWQTVEMNKLAAYPKTEDAVHDLMQAKVLLVSGRDSLGEMASNRKQCDILRKYVNRGGFIFAVGNCLPGSKFDTHIRTLVKNMFSEKGKLNPDIRLVPLPKEHPIYRSEHNLTANVKEFPLWGVNYGCRTAIVYAPVREPGFDLCCLWDKWQIQPTGKRPRLLEKWVSDGMKIGVNVIAYATGREPPQKLRPKDDSNARGVNDKVERGFLQVAKIIHAGDWDVAPRALRNLLIGLNKWNGLTANTKPQRDLRPTDKNLFRYPVAYMHGRNGFEMNEAGVTQLRKYLSERGGLLFADACCGSPGFDAGFRKLMTRVFPDKTLKRIPVKHELFTSKIGHTIKSVRRRMPESNNKKAALRIVVKKVEPFLEGIEIDGRLVVIYSKYDISCALERQASVSCRGYVEKDAMRIGINVMLYALLQDVRYSELLVKTTRKTDD
ncbi:MAG: DUF4159 domain-containing protein [Planctomycetaceae bacterium]